MGGFVGLLSGIFGVGGGFLMTPLLIMIGIPPTVAAASDSNQIVGASTSGTLAHYRLGNVDFKMGILLLIGGVLGGTLGVQLIKVLRAHGQCRFSDSDHLCDHARLCRHLHVSGKSPGTAQDKQAPPLATRKSPGTPDASSCPGRPSSKNRAFELSILMPLVLGIFVGILAAIMGVGGGFIMVPVMVYMLRMPMHVVVGTSLFQILFTCINVTIMQANTNHTVDFVLALILLIGSTLGAQFGAKISRRLKGDQLKIILASLVLLVMVKMLFGLLLKPGILLTYIGGH